MPNQTHPTVHTLVRRLNEEIITPANVSSISAPIVDRAALLRRTIDDEDDLDEREAEVSKMVEDFHRAFGDDLREPENPPLGDFGV